MAIAPCLLVLLFVYGTIGQPDWGWEVETPLDEYVNFDDGFFSWTEIGQIRYEREEVTVYLLNMTSQKWQDESLVDHPVWYHMMGVAVPDVINYPDAAYMWVGEQSNDWDDSQPENNASIYNFGISTIANSSRTIGAYTLQIPNQPLTFTNYPDPTDRISEDTLIGWSWRMFLDQEVDNHDKTLPLRMPMTKCAKRGIDAVQEFCAAKFGLAIDKFMALGASKRGWTVFSLAAVDPRIKMAIPIVFTLLNMEEAMMNHYRALDAQWTFAFEPYWEVNVTAEFHSPMTDLLFEIEDMYFYRSRLTMPKILILATGDEFFSSSDTHVWWDDMPDPKYLFFVENTEHILFPEYREVFSTVIGSFMTILDGNPLPSLTWTRTEFDGGSSIDAYVDPDNEPVKWTAMRAVTLANDTRRDFRLFAGYPEPSFHPVLWRNQSYDIVEPGHYHVEFDNVEDEWVGFYMFGYWAGPDGYDIYLSTEIQVTPDTFPAPVCTEDPDCWGNLV